MAKRSEWTFTYPAAMVAEASKRREGHHSERKRFWEGELETAEKALRAHGLELRDMPVTGGTRLDAVFDPQLKARVEECRGKVSQHERQLREYQAYTRALFLAARNGLTVDLNVDDIAFFEL